MTTDDGSYMPFQIRELHSAYPECLQLTVLVQTLQIGSRQVRLGEEFDKDFLASFMMAPRPLSLIFPPRSDV
jgi:hypothetical protein